MIEKGADDFIVRPGVLWEAQQIFDVYQRAFLSLEGRINPPSSARYQTVESLSKAFGRVSVAVSVLDEDIVGCVFFRPEDQGIYLYRLAVDPDYQGRGIASALVRYVQARAKEDKKLFVSLNVRIVLEGNQKLFSKLGFCEVSRHRHDGYDHDTYIRMEKTF